MFKFTLLSDSEVSIDIEEILGNVQPEKIDITKLDTERNMRYTWQAEGYAIHRGTIPREAIV